MALTSPTSQQRLGAQAAFLAAVAALRGPTRGQVAEWIDGERNLSEDEKSDLAGLDWPTFEVSLRHQLGVTVAPLFAHTAAAEAERIGALPGTSAFQRWWDRRVDVLMGASLVGVAAALQQAEHRQLDPWARAGVALRSAGLNAPQAVAVENLRNGIVESGMGAQMADARADQAAARYLAYREHVVADTELLNAQRAGRMAVDVESLSPDHWALEFQAWSGCCDACSDLDGDQADLDSGLEGEGGPHPNCLCDGYVPVMIGESR